MDQLLMRMQMRKEFAELLRQLEKNPNNMKIANTICKIQSHIKDLNKSLNSLPTSRKKMTSATVALLTSCKLKLEHLQKKSGATIQNKVGTSILSDNVIQTDSIEKRIKWTDLESAFRKRMRTGMFVNISHKNLDLFLKDVKILLVTRLQNLLQKKNTIKLNTILACNFEIVKQEEIIIETKYFTNGCIEILQSTDLDEVLTNNFERLKTDIEEKEMEGSGWTLHEIMHLEININDYVPLRGGLSTFIEIPLWIQKTKSVVNVKNYDDNYCFIWSVLAAIYKVEKNPQRVSSYENYKNNLNLDGITFPMSWSKIKHFEKNNKLKINVYGIDNTDDLEVESADEEADDSNKHNKKKKRKERIVPYYLSNNNDSNHETIHLLIIEKNDQNVVSLQDDEAEEEEENEETDYDDYDEYDFNNSINKKKLAEFSNYHFAWIKNLSRLVSSQISNHNGKKFICDRCLSYFHSPKSIENHNQQCLEKNQYAMIMPTEKNNILKFKNYKYQLKVPFVVYADLESILEKVTDTSNDLIKKNFQQKHIPNSVAYYIKCSYDEKLSKFELKRSKNCIEWFVNELEELAHSVDNILDNIKPMNLTFDEELEFSSSTKCHICKKKFATDDIKVRDHCHFTGIYRGAAHVE